MYIRNDAPEPWQLGLQDNASPIAEGILKIHNEILFYLLIILVLICWIISSIIIRFNEKSNKFKSKYLNHGTLIELIWTITPALILVAIAIPSFKLLYLMDEVIEPTITLKFTGHQWYWTIEYSDYARGMGAGNIEYDSYMIPTSDLEDGNLRLLEVDNRVILPVNTHVRVIVTSTDVIHSLAVPSLGVKIDCIPGRLNQSSFLIKREGVYYGQCSELCGIMHGFMPVVVEGVSLEKYLVWVNDNADGGNVIEYPPKKEHIIASNMFLLLYNRIKNKICCHIKSSLFTIQRDFYYICKIIFAIISVIFLFMVMGLYPYPLLILFNQLIDFDWLANCEGIIWIREALLNSSVMASGLPDEMDEADIKDTEKHEEYEKNVYSPENKEKMERSIAAVGNILKDGSLIAATVAGGFAGNDIKNGNIPKAVRSGLIATGSVIVGEVGKLACENIKRSIKNIPDYHPVDEPVSPSVYEVTEVTIKKAMLPIFDILGYISALDDGYKLAIYSVLLIIIAIGLGLLQHLKNQINKGINNAPINNKYFETFKNYKNIMNSISNIITSTVIIVFLVFAIISFIGAILLI